MPLVIYRDALQEVTASISDVKQFLDFILAANQLRPRVGQMIDYQGIAPEQLPIVHQFIQQKDYTLELGFNGLLVLLAGAFEQFVRRLLRDGVRWINTQVTEYESIRVNLRNQNLLRTGHALATINDPPAEIVFDYELLCSNLATCRTNGGRLILNADAFAVQLTNMTESRINDALRRLDVEIDWDVFGNDRAIQDVTGKKGREATKATKDSLKEFVKKRNQIAHTGVGGIKLAENELLASLAFFGAFTRALAVATEDAVRKSIR